MSREYAPTPGKWYENKDEEETFRVLSVDEDDELVEIEYEDGAPLLSNVSLTAKFKKSVRVGDKPE